MKKLIALALVAASANAPIGAQPKSGDCLTAQAETAHLYLKANGKDVKADPPAGGATGAGGTGVAGMAIDELGMPVDKKDKKGKPGIVVAGAGDGKAGAQASSARTGQCTVKPGQPSPK
jgi:hypothetical protein